MEGWLTMVVVESIETNRHWWVAWRVVVFLIDVLEELPFQLSGRFLLPEEECGLDRLCDWLEAKADG